MPLSDFAYNKIGAAGFATLVWIVPVTRNRVNRYGESIDQQWHIKTGTYQNAPINFNGYAVEKGLSPKAGAGIWIKYTIDTEKKLLYNFQFAE